MDTVSGYYTHRGNNMNFAFDMNKDLMLRTPNKLVCAAFHFQLELSFPSVTLGQIQELSNRDYRFHIILQMTEDTFLPFLVKPSVCFVLSYHTGALLFS